MFCPQCCIGYPEPLTECPACRVPLVRSLSDPQDLNTLIRTGISDPVAISLVKSLLREAGIPFFAMDQNPGARQESGNILGWWTFRVSKAKEAEAREILQSVLDTK